MSDHPTTEQLHERIDRLMADEPAHRPLPDLVRAGEQRLRRRRLSLGAGALAVGLIAVGGALALPGGDPGTVQDRTGFADTSSTSPSTSPTPTVAPSTDPEMGQTLEPGKRASYTYGIYPACGGGSCDSYRFESKQARKPVVAAIEFRLTDGNSKRVATDHGAYDVVIKGPLPAGDRWTKDGLVDADGQSVDLFAGLTLYAADGSVLATATSTYSDELDPYLELR